MTIEDIKQKYLEIIQKQNNLKGRVLDDFSEATETYVEIFGTYPECYYVDCIPDMNKTIDKLKQTIECFIPGAYDYYIVNSDNHINYDKIMYDSNILTTEGLVCVERNGITIYTNTPDFRDKVINCYVSVVIDNPCEVYWVTNGQNGFNATKLQLKDGKFNIKSHYNDDFDYDKVNEFINAKDSGLIILHGTCGSGNIFLFDSFF